MRILTEMAEGNAVTLMPIHAELTTQQAASILGVSRPFLIKQMRENKIPYRQIGTHRRVRFQDLMEYKNRIDANRAKVLEELAAELKNSTWATDSVTSFKVIYDANVLYPAPLRDLLMWLASFRMSCWRDGQTTSTTNGRAACSATGPTSSPSSCSERVR